MQLQSLQLLIKRHEQTGHGITVLANERVCQQHSCEDSNAALNETSSQHSHFPPCILEARLMARYFMPLMKQRDYPQLCLNDLVNTAWKSSIPLTTQMPVDPSDLLEIRTRFDFTEA